MNDKRRLTIENSFARWESLRELVQYITEQERDAKFPGSLDYTENAKISDEAYKNLCLALEHLDLVKHYLKEAQK